MSIDPVKLGKYLSFVLRHEPSAAGVVADDEGWVPIDELVVNGRVDGRVFALADILHVVSTNSKKRFALSKDGRMIRAVQGHSIFVNLALEVLVPPEFLWHGTANCFIESILLEGVTRRSRQYVHLSVDDHTAREVGSRHGTPLVLRVDAARMHRDGHKFFQAENGVWLTAVVPIGYFSIK